MLALWSARGPLSSWYSDLGGPLAIWRDLADDVAGGPVEGGHFFPEEHPSQTAAALAGFFKGVESIHSDDQPNQFGDRDSPVRGIRRPRQ